MSKRKQSEAAPRLDNDLKFLQSTSKNTQFSDKAALNLLYKLMEADNARRHPSMPYPLKPRRFDLRKTNELTKAVIKFILLNGFQAERIYSSTYVAATINKVSVKLKVEDNPTREIQSPAQQQLQQQVLKAGGLYFVVRSFGQFVYWFYLNFGKGKCHD
jgi:hypothetical protein